MTYDDELDERRPPTLRSALEDFAEVLCRPVATRLTRAVRWCEKLRRLEIDWTNFGCTRGGYFDWLGTPLVYKSDRRYAQLREEALIRVSGGLQLPWEPDRWRPWARWWPGFDWSLESYLPRVTAQRGGIRLVNPPGFPVYSATATFAPGDVHEFDLPFDSSDPLPYLVPREIPPLEE